MNILLVEDEPDFLDIMMSVLKKAGHNVTPAEDGHKALEFINTKAGEFEVLITDANIPGPKGQELVKIFRTKNTNAKICIASGHLDFEAMYKTELEPLRVKFFTKPFPQKQMLEWIKEAA